MKADGDLMENNTPSGKSGSLLWTIRYTLINATYFSAFCTIHACAAVFLLGNGFSNTEVGTTSSERYRTADKISPQSRRVNLLSFAKERFRSVQVTTESFLVAVTS